MSLWTSTPLLRGSPVCSRRIFPFPVKTISISEFEDENGHENLDQDWERLGKMLVIWITCCLWLTGRQQKAPMNVIFWGWGLRMNKRSWMMNKKVIWINYCLWQPCWMQKAPKNGNLLRVDNSLKIRIQEWRRLRRWSGWFVASGGQSDCKRPQRREFFEDG